MEKGFQLPNGHVLNMNPRPRNNSSSNNKNKTNREAVIVADSKLPTPDSNRKIRTRPDKSKDSGPMSDSSPSGGISTKLPVPKNFADKGKNQRKAKDVDDVENETPKENISYKSESASPMMPEGSSAKPGDNDQELYLRKIRGRLNKDSPLVAKSKEKQKEQHQGAYRKIMSFANGPRPAVTKNKVRNSEPNASETKLPMPGSNARTGIPSPSDKPRSASGGLSRSPAVHHAPNQKRGQQQQQQQQNEEPYNDASSQESSVKTNNTTSSSTHSHVSISPISGPSSSATEWEDKFVVNMPSAKDPNPPMMTAQQISQFQQSIEKVQRGGGSMDDPDASPSPRTTTPEDKLAPTETPQKPPTRRGRSNTTTNVSTPTAKEDNDQDTKAHLKSERYYTSQGVDKKRFSTIWEESPFKQKKKEADTGSDGCFVGCKEIKGPDERNPDEILYFSTTTERPKVVDISAPISRKPRAAGKPTGRRMVPGPEERLQIQREWRSISDNLKRGQSSMPLPKSLCQEPPCHQPGGKEKAQIPRSSSTPVNNSSTNKENDSTRDDEIVMNIPNVLHAPVASEETKAPRPTDLQMPKVNPSAIPASRMTTQTKPSSGLRPPTQSAREKGDEKPKASSSSSTTSTSPPILASIHINKSRGQRANRPPDNQRGVRGFMRIPGMVKSSTENLAESMRHDAPKPSSLPTSPPNGGANADANVPLRSISGPAQVAQDQNSSSSRGVSPIGSSTKSEGHDAKDFALTARIVEVAELDGHQLHGEGRRKKKATPSIATTSSTATTATTTNTSIDNMDNSDDEDSDGAPSGHYPLTLTLLFDILVLSITHFQRLTGDCLNSQHPQMVLRAVVSMVEHCIQVSRRISFSLSVYRDTGTWPMIGEGDLGRSLTDVGQAVVYLVVLGFVMIIVGRAAGYVVFVGGWVVWVAKPFGWAFGLLARALVP